MASDGSEEYVFAIPNFWRPSKLLLDLEAEAPSTASFFSNDLTNPFALDPITPTQDGFFKLLPIHELHTDSAKDDDKKDPVTPPVPKGQLEKPSDELPIALDSDDEDEEEGHDIWLEPRIPSKPKPPYRAWDGFFSGNLTTSYQPMMVTEAGPAAYDALLRSSNDPLKLRNTDVPVVDTKTYLSSLLALALGGESVLFTRKDGTQSLRPALPKMRASGYSSHVLQALENKCLRCGSTLVGLRSFVQSAYSEHPSRCGVALASTVSQVLQVVQEWVAFHGRNPRSLLQLQSTVNSMVAILRPFKALTSQLRHGLTDEDILNLVFHQAYAVDSNEEYLRQIMREVLRRVSGPWIEFLEEWIGTRREQGLPFTKANLGESKGFVKVEARVFRDDFGRELAEVDYVLAPGKMPNFMPEDVTETIFETGRNLRFIRSFHEDHPLAQQDVIASSDPPQAKWLYDWDAILRLESRAVAYRDCLIEAIQSSRSGYSLDPMEASVHSLADKSGSVLMFFGLDQIGMEERIAASIEQFAQPVATHDAEDTLSRIVRDRLSGTHASAIELSNSTPHWSLLPVLSFGVIASAQAQVVNKETLKLLFAAHNLRDHLRLQREFQLLGNGILCSRLSHALFDPDMDTAERRSGVARRSSVMGLRLGGRDNWPPASSELRLALMGILSECYSVNQDRKKVERNEHVFDKDISGLPGDMSFAVRDLTEEEIDKCMDPDSLEALDFLRLSYTAPPQLSPIITPMNLMQYDCIFKLLLRVLRMTFVVNQLFRDANSLARDWEDPGDATLRFVRESQHFVASVSTYFLDTGIAVPWRVFERKLDKVEADLHRPGTSSSSEEIQSPDKLQELHTLVLDRIMLALFLRKRQQPVLKLLEDIFNTILRFARHVRLKLLGKGGKEADARAEADPSALYMEFKKKVQIFITVCRSLSEKARRTDGKRGREDRIFKEQYGTGDDSMVAQLLVKLDMCDYYLKR
ncbi:gamma-tubulin complex component 6 [Trichoderma arundinaceum]|uniref:Spindle pole body component n=1 Tax=Trichoderma arundinaceum TaxID=490622 RepID=A0A395NZU1_TRIAR|nr:gamma-tubulin complex component 6 [Trichoderma arundinaceum]